MDHSASAAGHQVHQSVSISLIIPRYYRPALDEAAVADHTIIVILSDDYSCRWSVGLKIKQQKRFGINIGHFWCGQKTLNCSTSSTVLCKSLKPPIISLGFPSKELFFSKVVFIKSSPGFPKLCQRLLFRSFQNMSLYLGTVSSVDRDDLKMNPCCFYI